MTTFARSFGTRLRELRTDRRLTQTRLASLTGIPQSTISNWENAVCEPGLREAIGLSAALGVSLESFAELLASTASTATQPTESNWDKAPLLVQQA